MQLKIDLKIFEKFKGLHLGVVVAKGVHNQGQSDDILRQIKEQEARIKTTHTVETLPQHPKIDVWRQAYTSFGAKPKEHRSSIENLYRMILQGKELRHISKLVDIYNLISLKHMLPAGGEDTDKMVGDLILTFAGKNEPAVMLLGDKELKSPHEGEVIYKDSVSAICRRFNWREADRTKLTEETRNAIFVIEGLPPTTKQEVDKATAELRELIKQVCAGTVTSAVLDHHNSEIVF